MSVRKRGKSWVADWTNRDGKRCLKTFRLKEQALAYERQQRDLARSGELHDPQRAKASVSSLYLEWITTKSNVKPVTRQGYESVWRTVVEPRWGKTRLNQITQGDIKVWIANCESSGGTLLGPSRVRQSYLVLMMILDHAVDSGLIQRNPGRNPEGTKRGFLPESPTSDSMDVLQRSELQLLASECGEYADFVMLLGTVGLRFNEAASLKCSDLDFERNVIKVQRTFSDLNGRIIEQSPKNGKAREVPLPDSLRSSLLKRTIAASPNSYIWTASNGAPLRHSNFSSRVWKPALAQSGIKKGFKIHGLRHTAASWLVQSGCNVSHLAQMLGHADPGFTLKKYTHLFSDDIERIGRLLNQAETA